MKTPDYNVEVTMHAVKEYFDSIQRKDFKIMRRTLGNGLVEISGNGIYLTCTKQEFLTNIKKFKNELLQHNP